MVDSPQQDYANSEQMLWSIVHTEEKKENVISEDRKN